MQIESFFIGRVRVRSEAFLIEEAVEKIKEKLKNYPGIHTTEINIKTGSLLIKYDVTKISTDLIMQAKKELEELEKIYLNKK